MSIRCAVVALFSVPRLENEEADTLTNLDFRHFAKDRRVPVDLDRLGFKVLPMLFEVGENYVAELEQWRAADKAKRQKTGCEGGKAQGEGKRRPGDSLRERDPW